MYATAQRVLSRTTHHSGINSFLYLHNDRDYPEIDWSAPVVHQVGTILPGRLTEETEREVPPGGNEVLSYLDVAADDTTDVSRVEAALDTFRQLIQPGELDKLSTDYGGLDGNRPTELGIAVQSKIPPAVVIDRIGVCFDAAFNLSGSSLRLYLDEYETLKQRVLALLRRRSPGG